MFEVSTLNMKENSVSDITPQMLEGLDYIRIFDFGENKIERVRENVFKK
jgi:hypothetical protein